MIARPRAVTQQTVGRRSTSDLSLHGQTDQIPQVTVMEAEENSPEAAWTMISDLPGKSTMRHVPFSDQCDTDIHNKTIAVLRGREPQYFLQDTGERHRPGLLDGVIGIIDVESGRFVVETTACTEFIHQAEPLAHEITEAIRGRRAETGPGARAGRHAVTTGFCPWARTGQVELRDMDRKRHGPDGYPVCRISVNLHDQDAVTNAESLLKNIARQLDGNPLNWTDLRRRRRP